MIENEVEENYRVCEMCHSMFPESHFDKTNNPNLISITTCPYCEDKEQHWVKVKVKLIRNED